MFTAHPALENPSEGTRPSSKPWIRRLGLVVTLVSLAGLAACPGCVFARLKRDLETMQETLAALKGDVVSSMTQSGPIFVVLWDADEPDRGVLRHWPMYSPGEFRFVVQVPGRYHLLAFQDRNRDLVFQSDEPAAFWGNGAALSVSPGQQLVDLHIPLAEDDRVSLNLPVDLSSKSEVVTFEGFAIGNGEIRDINDPRFTQENAAMGMWEPLRFVKEVGMGLYFLDAFDPNKTPVLFIHGLAGHPGQWESIVARLDRDRFQPWLYYYPSGVRLQTISDGLYQMVETLRARHGFDRMHVVAHSMGGMVARGFLNTLVRQESPLAVPLFVTISTPWGGHEAAELGVKHAPAVVPSWLDMLPGSDFQNGLWQTALPDGTTFYLMFSFRGNRNSFMDRNNDGTVTLASALDMRAQVAAEKVYGFFEDHVSILSSGEVASLLTANLERWRTGVSTRP